MTNNNYTYKVEKGSKAGQWWLVRVYADHEEAEAMFSTKKVAMRAMNRRLED